MAATATPSALRRFFALDPLDNRYPSLHGVRFLAIVSVVQYHITGVFGRMHGPELDPELAASSTRIFFGMDLFFLLSGFLIGSILLHSLHTTGRQDVRRFYLRRMFRTFPPYYLVLTLLALTRTLTAEEAHNLPFEYAYLTNFTKLASDDLVMGWGWSLALEEQFYLTVPLLFFVLHRLPSDRARIGMLFGLWTLGTVSRFAIWASQPVWDNSDFMHATYFRTYTRFDTIVCGILLAFVHTRYGDTIQRWLAHPLHRGLLAIPALGCLWVLLRPTMFPDEHTLLVRVFLWGTVTSVMYFCGLLLLLHGEGLHVRFLSAPIFRALATLGYGVYLVHVPVIEHLVPVANALAARGWSPQAIWPLALAVAMLGSLALGYVLHILVEKPALRIRQRLAA